MYKETPRYPVSDPLPYINDEKNLPAGVIWLGEFFEKDNGNHVFISIRKTIFPLFTCFSIQSITMDPIFIFKAIFP